MQRNFKEYEQYKTMYPQNNQPPSYIELQRRINLTT